MSASTPLVSTTDDERWIEWQARALEGDRRRAIAMKWVLGIIVLTVGALFAVFSR